MTGTGRDHTFHEIRPVQTLRTPAFELREGRGHGDFADHDRRLEEIAREAAAADTSRTARLLAPPVAALSELSLYLGDDGEDLLEDARANVGNGEYRTALELLTEFLETSPEHQEARYLRAFCLFHLAGGNRTQALRVLRPLRDEPLPEDLRPRVSELRRELRRLLTPVEITAYAETSRSDPEGALERVEAFLELAPEEGSLSYLLAVGQARAGDTELALETAERGAREADTDKEGVAAYARRLRLVVLIPHAARAVAAFKDGEPRRARRELAAMDPHRRRAVVLDDFEAHLRLVDKHGDRTPYPEPRLSEDRAEDLYTLLAEADTQRAANLLAMGRVEGAKRLMENLLPLVPGFRWLNFLYAACLLSLGQDPDRAAVCAEIAQRDPTLAQAPELLRAIRDWQEAAVVNPVVKEYVDIMESVRGGVSEAARLTTVRTRLTDLRRRLPQLRGRTRTEVGRQVVRQLDDAIVERLGEIELVAASMAVSDLVGRFNALAQQGRGASPHMTRAQLSGILQDARRLRRDSARTLSTDSRKLLDELIGTIARALG
ncbi:tetratricopeptide repeat protein [Streptomyces sp. AK08-02]|uniref:tetratricopeptide repeat protein n=1 Tax=Streptomyces sp. AK08-02 TaxID=3028654 RepID=UPI0029ADD609|nr:tetratricopeptide repeat protein [Streptomyces sp. AK08-02]MDX3748397.1 tetratricopeptide repeat protein [Streptomyces sp. AK08-02]